jgi:plasmid stabilization system protein ParE
MALVWSDRARNDLREIARYISRSNPGNARAFVMRLQTRARLAAKTPRAGRRVPEFDADDLREVIEGSYRIVYRHARRRVEVVTVIEGHRLLWSK